MPVRCMKSCGSFIDSVSLLSVKESLLYPALCEAPCQPWGCRQLSHPHAAPNLARKKKTKNNRVNKKADAYISRSDHRYKETLSKIGSVRVRLLWTGPSGELCVKGRDLNDIKEQTTKRQSVRSKADSKHKDSRVRMVGYHIRRQARHHCGWV